MKKKLSLIWLIVFIYAANTLINYKIESNKNNTIYNNHRITNDSDLTASNIEFNKTTVVPFEKKQSTILNRYKPFIELNDEVIGWIKIQNTVLDYPVFKADNNEFYLNHDPYKESNIHGSIFMDFRNGDEIEDFNTIIYGHYIKDGSMFTDLKKYKEMDFLKANPIIEFSNLYEEVKWEIFSVYITDTTFDYIQTDFANTEDRQTFLNNIKERSKFHSDVLVSAKDNILTLSTCSYEFSNARLVIHAKRI